MPEPDVDLILADLERLVTVESPSGDPEAVRRSAAAVSAVVEARLGVTPEVIDIDGVRHLRVRWGSPRLLILAHHDTVWPQGTLAELPYTVEDGVVRGPGCFDMKLGLVQAIHALALADRPLDGVTLLVTGDEEVGSRTSRALIEAEATGCRAALVLEAAADGGAIKVERAGVSNYRIVVTGRAAHAGLEPEKGVNAGIALAHAILGLEALADAAVGTTVTPTTVAAGTTTNTVPESGHVDVDVRVRSLAEQQRVDAGIRALESGVPGATITVTGGPNRPPLELAMSEGLYALASGLSDELGLPPLSAVGVGGASDGNFTAGLGVPTLDGLGAVGGGAHARDEHALVSWIRPRTTLLAALIERIATSGVSSA